MVFDPQPNYLESYDTLPEPQYGNPMDSRWGGPTPWQQSLAEWSQIGSSPGQRPFEGVGKFDATQALPLSPVIPTMQRNAPPQQAPAPQPGLFEALGRGLPVMVTQFLGNGTIDEVAGSIGGTIGSILDLPLNILPAQDVLSGGYSVEEMYSEVGEDALKRQYDAYIAADKTNAARYMSQYLEQRGTEVADILGISGVHAPMWTPSSNMGEQVRRLFFGGMSALGDGVARTYAGSWMRDAEGQIWGDNVDPSTLAPELQELRERVRSGDLTEDEAYDELTVGRFRWTNDDSLWGAGISLVMDIVSDPLIWASFGLGTAAKAMQTGSVRAAKNAIAQSVRKGGMWDNAVDEAFQRSRYSSREAWTRELGSEGITDEVVKWAEQNGTRFVDEGLNKLNRRQRAVYEVEPIIAPMAKLANEIDSMFGWFGTGRVGRVLSQRVTSNRMRGWASYYGAKRFKAIQDYVGGRTEDINRYQAIAAQNRRMSLEQQHLTKEAMGADPQWRGKDFSPQELAEARLSLDEQNTLEMQRHTARTSEDFLSDKPGEANVRARREQELDLLANDWAAVTGKTTKDARAWLAKQDQKTLQLVHDTAYGYNISRFLENKRTAVLDVKQQLDAAIKAGADEAVIDGLRKTLGQYEHYGLVSERTLTDVRAKKLLDDISRDDDAARRAAAKAVEDYDSLGHSFADSKLSGEEVRVRVKEHLEHLLEDEGRLMKEVDPADLHPDVARAMGGSKYKVGYAPSDRWGLTRSADGTIKGVNTYMDVVDDVSPTDFNRPWGQRDIWKERFFGSIHGARLFYEAEAKFKELGVRQYGLTKADSQRLFRAIHEESSKQNVGTRGLSTETITRIADDLDLDPATRARTGPGSLLDLTLRAFEGDLATVGALGKATGKMKTFGGRLDNLVGVVSESIYPKVRFGLNPIFVLMETVEGPFFALLRGIKPGVRWTADDIRMNRILEYLHTGKVRYADQLERAQLAVYDQDLAVRLSKQVNGQQGWRRLAPWNWRTKNPLEHGIKVSGPWDLKRLQYVKQAGREAAEEWERMMDRADPELLATWKAEMGTSNPQQLYMRIMEEKGDISDSGRYTLHLMDAVKPLDLGRRERIRMSDVARFNGYDNVSEMSDAIRRGELTESAFIDKYTRLNVPRPFAERAWRVASGFSDEEWKVGIREALQDPKAATAYEAWHRWMANKAGMSFEEFMNTNYGALPQLIDNQRGIPVASFYQTSLEDGLARAGMNVYKKGSPEFDDARRIMAEHGPGSPEAKKAVSAKTGKESSKYENAQVEKHVAGSRAVDADPVAVAPEGLRAGMVAREVKDADGNVSTVTELSTDQMDEMVAQLYADFDAVPGGDTSALQSGLEWYDEMMTVFLGISHAMPESLVRGLLERWTEVAPREVASAFDADLAAVLGTSGALTDEALKQARVQLAARLNIAFAGSQMNSSVLFGMRSILSTLDEAAFARGRGAFGMETVVTRLTQVLREFGDLPPDALGPKLLDFYDSLVGNKTRTLTKNLGGDTLQPGAMDIWMRRAWGYGDSAYLNKMAVSRLTRKGDKVTPEAIAREEAAFAKEMGWDLDAARNRSNDAPSDAEYVWMLRSTNQLAKYINENDLLGLGREVSVAELQAAQWVGLQNRMDYAGSPPVTLLRQAGVQTAAEAFPGPGSIVERWMPNVEEMLKEFDGDEVRLWEALEDISYDIQHRMTPVFSELSGATPLGLIDASGMWTPPGLDEAGNPRAATFTPNATTIWTGSPVQTEIASRLQALMMGQEAVYVLGMWDEGTTKTTRSKPVVRSNQADGRQWSLDLAFDDVFSANEARPYYEYLNRWLAGEGSDLPAGVQRISLADLDIKPGNRLGKTDVEALAADMRERGYVGDPIDITYYMGDRTVDVGEGNHRLAAAKLAGLEDIPVKVTRRQAKGGGTPVKGIDPDEFGYVTASPLAADVLDVQPVQQGGGALSRAGLTNGEFVGSMAGLLDDESPALRMTWDQQATPALQREAKRAQMRLDSLKRRRDEAMRAVREPTPKPPGKPKRTKAMSDADWAKREAAYDQLRAAYDDAKATEVERSAAVKEYYSELVKDAEKDLSWANPDLASLTRFEENVKLRPDDIRALEDGTWVHRLDPNAEPMPVYIRRNPVQVNYWDGDHAARLKELGVDVDQVRDRYSQEVRALYEDSYSRVAPTSTKKSVNRAKLTEDPDAPFFQREVDPANPDGSRGRARAAFHPSSADGRAAAFFIRDRADSTTAIHEGFHLFARHLDQSGKDALVAAYNDAHGLTGTRHARRAWNRRIEEWASREFERFAGGDLKHAGDLAPIFKGYSEWATGPHSTITPGSPVGSVFEKVLRDWGDVPSGTYNLETERMWSAARYALMKAEDEAFSTAYYRRGRTWMERSLNHPYLGLYPISYMWGKVLPEMMRFLVRRPFGLKAPLGGLMGAKHVWRNMQMQLEVDEDLSTWVDEHPQSIRFLQMMTPGTPWELPVNMPAVSRHFIERQLENQLRKERGQQPLGYDLGAGITDTLSYSVGYAQMFERLGNIGEELQDVGGSALEASLENFTSLDTQSFI